MKKLLLFLGIVLVRVGLGQSITISPTVDEHKITTYGGNSPSIIGVKAEGVPTSPTATALGSSLLTLSGRGYFGSGFHTIGSVGITFNTSQLFSSTGLGTNIRFVTTAINSTSAFERVRIENNGNVGFGTTTPDTKVDISGDLSFSKKGLINTVGIKDDYNRGNNSVISITSANVGLTGINNPFEGTVLHLYCTSGLLIYNENVGSTAANRIITGAGEDIILRGASGATLIYDATAARWRVISANSNGMPWTMNGNTNTSTNSFIGTTDAKSLRIRTNDIERMKVDSVGKVRIGNKWVDNSQNPPFQDTISILHVSKGNRNVDVIIPEGSVASFENDASYPVGTSVNIVGSPAALNFLRPGISNSDPHKTEKVSIYSDINWLSLNDKIEIFHSNSVGIRMLEKVKFEKNYEFKYKQISNLPTSNLSLDRGTEPILRLKDLAGNTSISGIQNCKEGSVIIIVNEDPTYNLTFNHQSPAADFGEKLLCPKNTNLVIGPTGSVTLMGVFVYYDAGAGNVFQWRVISVLN